MIIRSRKISYYIPIIESTQNLPKIYFHVLFKHNCYIFIVLSLSRLGFGSFVDKVVMPYVSTVPRKLKEPCDGCAAPYGFKHHMRLSTDTSGISLGVFFNFN